MQAPSPNVREDPQELNSLLLGHGRLYLAKRHLGADEAMTPKSAQASVKLLG